MYCYSLLGSLCMYWFSFSFLSKRTKISNIGTDIAGNLLAVCCFYKTRAHFSMRLYIHTSYCIAYIETNDHIYILVDTSVRRSSTMPHAHKKLFD